MAQTGIERIGTVQSPVRLRHYGSFVFSHFEFLAENHGVNKYLVTKINLHYAMYGLLRVRLAPQKEHTACCYEKNQSEKV